VAKFTYVGSDRFGSSPELTIYGATWRMGEVSEVTEPAYVDKLRTIDAFVEVKPGRPTNEDAEKVAKAKTAAAQKFKPLEENGEPAKPKAKASQSTIADLGPDQDWDDV
jgi:hypothetical protein